METVISGNCIRLLTSQASNTNSEFYQYCEDGGYPGWQNQFSQLMSALQYDSASDYYIVSPELEERLTSWTGDLGDIYEIIAGYGQEYENACEFSWETGTFISSGQLSVGG